MKSDMHAIMDRLKHPFYRHSEADFFIAEDQGQVVGRLSVLHNRNYCAHHQVNTAFIYFFDAIDDLQVSRRLFDTVFQWAKQRSISSIVGPRGFTRSSGIGMLVEGYENDPLMGIPYNYKYYPKLIEDAGFIKETDYLSGYLVKQQTMDQRIYQAAEKIKKRGNFWIKTFKSKAEMREMVPVINEVHNKAFQTNPGYYPSTPDEFNLIARTMIQIADRRMVKIIMKGEEVAGFIISYKNICDGIRKSGGHLFPFGWVPILIDQRNSRKADINGLGLLPEYQGMGANLLLYTELESTLREFQIERAELVQIDERNFKSKSDMENMGVTWNQRHRLYRRNLND
jgi:ribosomal protein S18 acetylase RimI-like enzyme